MVSAFYLERTAARDGEIAIQIVHNAHSFFGGNAVVANEHHFEFGINYDAYVLVCFDGYVVERKGTRSGIKRDVAAYAINF